MADFDLPPIGDEEVQEEQKPKFFGEYDTPEAAEQAFKDMKAKLDAQAEESRRMQERLDLMMARPERPEPVQLQNSPSFPEMPDPVEDPKGYKEAMKRFQETVAADIRSQHERLEQSRIEAERKANAEKLWNDFRTKYEDLDDEVLAGAIASREAQAIREAGGDPTRYMSANPEGFMERVASGMRAHISRYRDKPASRTGGIPGGTVSPSSQKPEPRVPSFIEQIKEVRAESEKAFR